MSDRNKDRHSSEWQSWRSMRDRCLNPSGRNYPAYGGRGITVCERWQSLDAFKADMGPRPAGTTLDRIDTLGNYEPGNCRWATPLEQSRNRRTVRQVELRGETLPLPTLADRFGLTVRALRQRLDSGWSPERALELPLGQRSTKLTAEQQTEIRRRIASGRHGICKVLAEEFGVTRGTIWRINKSVEHFDVARDLEVVKSPSRRAA